MAVELLAARLEVEAVAEIRESLGGSASRPFAPARRNPPCDRVWQALRQNGLGLFEGDGPLSASLDPKPAKHCDGNVMNAMTDEYLFRVIQQGGAAVGKSPLMAPWGGTLGDAQIRDVVAFVRTLASPAYPPKS